MLTRRELLTIRGNNLNHSGCPKRTASTTVLREWVARNKLEIVEHTLSEPRKDISSKATHTSLVVQSWSPDVTEELGKKLQFPDGISSPEAIAHYLFHLTESDKKELAFTPIVRDRSSLWKALCKDHFPKLVHILDGFEITHSIEEWYCNVFPPLGEVLEGEEYLTNPWYMLLIVLRNLANSPKGNTYLKLVQLMPHGDASYDTKIDFVRYFPFLALFMSQKFPEVALWIADAHPLDYVLVPYNLQQRCDLLAKACIDCNLFRESSSRDESQYKIPDVAGARFIVSSDGSIGATKKAITDNRVYHLHRPSKRAVNTIPRFAPRPSLLRVLLNDEKMWEQLGTASVPSFLIYYELWEYLEDVLSEKRKPTSGKGSYSSPRSLFRAYDVMKETQSVRAFSLLLKYDKGYIVQNKLNWFYYASKKGLVEILMKVYAFGINSRNIKNALKLAVPTPANITFFCKTCEITVHQLRKMIWKLLSPETETRLDYLHYLREIVDDEVLTPLLCDPNEIMSIWIHVCDTNNRAVAEVLLESQRFTPPAFPNVFMTEVFNYAFYRAQLFAENEKWIDRSKQMKDLIILELVKKEGIWTGETQNVLRWAAAHKAETCLAQCIENGLVPDEWIPELYELSVRRKIDMVQLHEAYVKRGVLHTVNDKRYKQYVMFAISNSALVLEYVLKMKQTPLKEISDSIWGIWAVRSNTHILEVLLNDDRIDPHANDDCLIFLLASTDIIKHPFVLTHPKINLNARDGHLIKEIIRKGYTSAIRTALETPFAISEALLDECIEIARSKDEKGILTFLEYKKREWMNTQ